MAKVPIACKQRQAMLDCQRCDPHIVLRDRTAFLAKPIRDPAIFTSRLLVAQYEVCALNKFIHTLNVFLGARCFFRACIKLTNCDNRNTHIHVGVEKRNDRWIGIQSCYCCNCIKQEMQADYSSHPNRSVLRLLRRSAAFPLGLLWEYGYYSCAQENPCQVPLLDDSVRARNPGHVFAAARQACEFARSTLVQLQPL